MKPQIHCTSAEGDFNGAIKEKAPEASGLAKLCT